MIENPEIDSFFNLIVSDLEKDPNFYVPKSDVHYLMGISALRRYDFAKAHAHFNFSLDNGNKTSHLFLGLIEEVFGNFFEAESHYMAIAFQGSKHAFYLLGRIEDRKGDPEKAAFFFRKALSLGFDRSFHELDKIKINVTDLKIRDEQKVADINHGLILFMGPFYFLFKREYRYFSFHLLLVLFFFIVSRYLPTFFPFWYWFLSSVIFDFLFHFNNMEDHGPV